VKKLKIVQFILDFFEKQSVKMFLKNEISLGLKKLQVQWIYDVKKN
jgi:hypothetical protein